MLFDFSTDPAEGACKVARGLHARCARLEKKTVSKRYCMYYKFAPSNIVPH